MSLRVNRRKSITAGVLIWPTNQCESGMIESDNSPGGMDADQGDATNVPKHPHCSAGTRFKTLSSIYDKVDVEDMRAAMERANQAVSQA